MVEDDVLREVRAAREAYARSHNFNIDAMVEDLRRRELASGWQIVSHPPRRVQAVAPPSESAKQEPQTGAA
jgi:hypothetical protein